MKALPIVALAMLPGCAGVAARSGEWTRPDTAAAVQRHDEYECEREAVQRRTAAGVATAVFEACMRERGYARVPR